MDYQVTNQKSPRKHHPRPLRDACLFALALCASSGCNVGPDYAPPWHHSFTDWKHPQDPVPVNAPCSQWWSDFGDPTLDALIHEAVAANPGVHEATFRVMEARARRGIVNGERLPQFNGTGSYGYKKVSGNSSPYALQSQNAYHLFSSGFDASWELDLWGKYRRAIEAADAEICVTESDYDFVLLTLLGDVASTYVDIRLYQQRIDVARRNLEIQEGTLKLAREQHRAGLAKPLHVTQAESDLHATVATVPTLEIGLQHAENRLCVLLGQLPRDLANDIGEQRPIPVSPPEVALGMPTELLRRRPDIQSAEQTVAAESARIGVATADLYPQFSLTGTISVDSTDVATLFTPESIAHKVGPSFTWDILNFGRTRNKINAQEARFQQAAWRYRATILNAVEEVENALSAYTQEQVRRNSLEQAVAASRESVRLSQIYFSNGMSTFQTVLDSQRSLLTLEDQLTISRAKVALNRIALYKALGGGWESIQCDAVPEPPPSSCPEVLAPQLDPLITRAEEVVPLPPVTNR